MSSSNSTCDVEVLEGVGAVVRVDSGVVMGVGVAVLHVVYVCVAVLVVAIGGHLVCHLYVDGTFAPKYARHFFLCSSALYLFYLRIHFSIRGKATRRESNVRI